MKNTKNIAIDIGLLEFCGQFNKYIHRKRTSFIVYGSARALELLSESPQALIDSDCTDYFITVMGHKKEPNPELVYGQFEVDGHSLISDKDYAKLYRDISVKLRSRARKQANLQ